MIRATRRLACTFASLAIVAVTAAPLSAHEAARLEIVEPQPNATVLGTRLNIVIRGIGGVGPASYQLFLDDQLIDIQGQVGADSAFTTHRLAGDEFERLSVLLLQSGAHEVRLRYVPDPDDPRPDLSVRFRIGSAKAQPPQRNGWALVASALIVGVSLTASRLRAAG